jgi:Uma2 family endonuclease
MHRSGDALKNEPAETAEDSPLLYPITIKLPAPLDDDMLLWLSANNRRFGFEQSAEGDLILSPPTNSPGNHGELLLTTQLINWNDRTKFGEVRGISGGVQLPKGGQREPDAFVVPRATWDEVRIEDRRKGYVPVLPVAAFELLSPKNVRAGGFRYEFMQTLVDYERSAVPLVVVLDPRTELSTIRRPRAPQEVLADSVLRFPELPGLELDVKAIYKACNNP